MTFGADWYGKARPATEHCGNEHCTHTIVHSRIRSKAQAGSLTHYAGCQGLRHRSPPALRRWMSQSPLSQPPPQSPLCQSAGQAHLHQRAASGFAFFLIHGPPRTSCLPSYVSMSRHELNRLGAFAHPARKSQQENRGTESD